MDLTEEKEPTLKSLALAVKEQLARALVHLADNSGSDACWALGKAEAYLERLIEGLGGEESE